MIGGKQVIVGTVFLAAFASAVILKRDPFIRLIPADVLRGKWKIFYAISYLV